MTLREQLGQLGRPVSAAGDVRERLAAHLGRAFGSPSEEPQRAAEIITGRLNEQLALVSEIMAPTRQAIERMRATLEAVRWHG